MRCFYQQSKAMADLHETNTISIDPATGRRNILIRNHIKRGTSGAYAYVYNRLIYYRSRNFPYRSRKHNRKQPV